MARPDAIDRAIARFDREIGLEAVPRVSAAHAEALVRVSGPPEPPAPIESERLPAGLAAPAPARAPAPASVHLHPYPAESLAAPADEADRVRRLAALEARHAESCPHCLAAKGHLNLVFGEGSPTAEVMFVGEAPGETEDRVGRPFVGPAGEKLDEMIRAMGLRREDTYIANVLKSRPPGNRTPMPDEVARCGPFLVEQILAVRPKVLVALGGPAAKWLCGIEGGITRARGIWHEWSPPAGADCGAIPVMPTYHPAYVLRTYTPQVRSEVWSDLRAVLARIGREPPQRKPRD